MENAIGHTQATALKGRRFESLEEQNEFLEHWERKWAAPRIHGSTCRQAEDRPDRETRLAGSRDDFPGEKLRTDASDYRWRRAIQSRRCKALTGDNHEPVMQEDPANEIFIRVWIYQVLLGHLGLVDEQFFRPCRWSSGQKRVERDPTHAGPPGDFALSCAMTRWRSPRSGTSREAPWASTRPASFQ
ncbi:hypothetical protein J2W96_006731 [Variovorax guangxiensis]|nr:hypothetical protein [Variovorax guangxiensis]